MPRRSTSPSLAPPRTVSTNGRPEDRSLRTRARRRARQHVDVAFYNSAMSTSPPDRRFEALRDLSRVHEPPARPLPRYDLHPHHSPVTVVESGPKAWAKRTRAPTGRRRGHGTHPVQSAMKAAYLGKEPVFDLACRGHIRTATRQASTEGIHLPELIAAYSYDGRHLNAGTSVGRGAPGFLQIRRRPNR
jgi:hypothetical protein